MNRHAHAVTELVVSAGLEVETGQVIVAVRTSRDATEIRRLDVGSGSPCAERLLHVLASGDGRVERLLPLPNGRLLVGVRGNSEYVLRLTVTDPGQQGRPPLQVTERALLGRDPVSASGILALAVPEADGHVLATLAPGETSVHEVLRTRGGLRPEVWTSSSTVMCAGHSATGTLLLGELDTSGSLRRWAPSFRYAGTVLGWHSPTGTVLVTSALGGDFIALCLVDRSGDVIATFAPPGVDVDGGTVTADGVLATVNRHCTTEIVHLDDCLRPLASRELNGEWAVRGGPGSTRFLVTGSTSVTPPGVWVGQVGVETFGLAEAARSLLGGADREGSPAIVEPVSDVPVVRYPGAGDDRHGRVLVIHGGPGVEARPRYELDGLARHWQSTGVDVLFANLSGSSGFGRDHAERIAGSWGSADLADLLRLIQAEPGPCVLVGFSYGGFVALAAALRGDHRLRAVALVSAPSGLLLRPDDAVATDLPFKVVHGVDAGLLSSLEPVTGRLGQLPPLLVAHGACDEVVPVEQSDHLVAALRSAGVSTTYLRVPGAGHTFLDADQQAALLDGLDRVVADALRGAAACTTS